MGQRYQEYKAKCRVCQGVTTFEVREKDLQSWRKGVNIQYAMPYLDIDTRELLISGICGKCFDNLLGPEE